MLDVYGINTGDGLTGKHYSTFVQVNDPITHVGKDDFYNNDIAGFFEDSWKANSKLTLNMGLRYDLSTIPQPPQPNTLTPLTTLYTSTIHIPKDQFAPRLGVAWQVSPNTVLRTGYGHLLRQDHQHHLLRHARGERRLPADVQLHGDHVARTDLSQRDLDSAGTAAGCALRRCADAAGDHLHSARRHASRAAVSRPDWVNPRVHEGDVTLERQLPGGISGSVAYVVSRGVHLPIFVDANLAPSTSTKSYDILSASGATTQTYTVPFYTNRIDTGTGEIFVGYSDVNSWYNSMVISVRRPMRHGLEFTANYTLSKAVDGAQVAGTGGTFNGSDISFDPKNRKAEYGLSDLDQRHRFVANAVWMPMLAKSFEQGGQDHYQWLGPFHHRHHVHRPAGNAAH